MLPIFRKLINIVLQKYKNLYRPKKLKNFFPKFSKMYNNSYNNFRPINSGLQHPIVVNSSNNYNGMNDNIFTIPAGQSINNNGLSSSNYNNMDVSYNGMRAISGQQSTFSNGSVAQPSSYAPHYIGHVNGLTLDQHTQYTSHLIESSSSINSLNITINSHQTNLSKIFKFGFKIVILPISPPIMDNQNQHICLNS